MSRTFDNLTDDSVYDQDVVDCAAESSPCTKQSLEGTTPCTKQSLEGTTPCTKQSLEGTTSCTKQSLEGTTPCTKQSLEGTTPCTKQSLEGTTSCTKQSLEGTTSESDEVEKEKKTKPQRRVHFSTEPPKVHVMRVWAFAARQARAGNWILYAINRERFKRRIAHVERAISWVLGYHHRIRIILKRFIPWWNAQRRKELEEKKEAEEREKELVEKKRAEEREEITRGYMTLF